MVQEGFKKKRAGPVLTGVLFLFLCGGFLFYHFQTETQEEKQNQPVVEFRLGLPLQPSSGLLIIALENNYFNQNGLDVKVVKFPSGKRALNEGLFPKQVDVAGASDLPVTIAGMQRKDFKIIASTFSSNDINSIIARTDAGIETPMDLRAKRIATQEKSAVHYFLHLFLVEHKIPETEVSLSFMKSEELPRALASGRIDAFSMRSPYIEQARELLGNKCVIFKAPGLYEQKEFLLVQDETIRKKPAMIPHLLKALFQAEAYIRENQEKATAIIAARLDTDPADLSDQFSKSTYQLSLDQSLIIRMEDQARWINRREHGQSYPVPNYLYIIRTDELKNLKKEVVTLY